tara:strand:- start:3046 stop:4398 length:1353 start_codon:yes stop_codon:yes gene_type:complete
MKLIKVNKTYSLKIKGKPSTVIDELKDPDLFVINPKRISKFKVKLLVKEGDSVKIGSELFTDKKQSHVVFLSPVAGIIEKIELGDRRSIERIIIKKATEEESIDLFKSFQNNEIAKLDREEVVDKLIKGGSWALLNEYPFNNIPKKEIVPPSIIVSIDYDEPFMPDSEVFLKEYENEFLAGIDVLKKITPNVRVGVSENNASSVSSGVKNVITHKLRGSYPANDPGIFLYYVKETVEENKSWGIRALDVIRIGQLFLTGKYPTERLIVVSGALSKKPRYLKTREAVSLDFMKNELLNEEPCRMICGGVLTGHRVSLEDGLGYHDYSIHLIREGKEQELLSFFRPGLDKPTFSNTYLSATIDKEDWELTTSLSGGHRACISCGHCTKVCSVESSPQLIMKSLKANDYETAVEYGLLDTVNTGIYTYVCPSKIEIDKLFTDAKDKLYKDLTA